MARRAVQGYTEKSLYENTRYLGVIATNDPLNEGYFKQLVNFNISDTGQSLTPRQGFLTTSLRNIDSNKSLITLSDQVILFYEQDVQNYIIFDLKYFNAYIADISAYNLDEKLLPIVYKIPSAVLNEGIYEFHMDISGMLSYFEKNIPAWTDVKDDIEANYTTDYIIYNAYVGYLKEHLSIVEYDPTAYIYDEYLIRKYLIKMSINVSDTEYTFMMQLHYRTEGNEFFPLDNTLIIEALDTYTHPTYDVTQRNIANPNNIIPDPMQVVYTTENRPAGHVNFLNPLMYVQDPVTEKHMNAYIYPFKDYTLRPNFALNPASYTINSETAKWAFRFDIISTGNQNLLADEIPKDIIYKTPWATLEHTPSIVFNKSILIDLTNVNIEERHFKGLNYMLTLVPKERINITCENNDGACTYSCPELGVLNKTKAELEIALINQSLRVFEWSTIRNSIEDYESLKSAIIQFEDNAEFMIHNLSSADSYGGDFEPTEDKTLPFNEFTLIGGASGPGIYENKNFLTATEVLNLFELNKIFEEDGIVLRMFPYKIYYIEHVYISSSWDHTDFATLYTHEKYFTDPEDTSITTHWDVYNRMNFDNVLNYIPYNDIDDVVEMSLSYISNIDILNKFFTNGYNIRFYLIPYATDDLIGVSERDKFIANLKWDAIAYSTSRPIYIGFDDLAVTTIVETISKDPALINNATKYISFREEQLVVWNANTVFISEPNKPYYFKEEKKFEFNEHVVKVLPYKEILLVFTVQHLYAIYKAEETAYGTDAEGKQVSMVNTFWAKQCVLYNILTNEKYADAIQIFNQTVLFYSEDGQMFMIKPSTMIDSETRFSLQYFNKSVNDILLNYDVYINERLIHYDIDKVITKDDVTIKALININQIKIFYCVPGFITYILIYDVINNRYTVYDTIIFTDIRYKLYTKYGEVYLTNNQYHTYFSMIYKEPNVQDNNVDMCITTNFKKISINALIDTGNINLNNHLRKRFRDLLVTYKNIDASNIFFYAETNLDEVIAKPFYDNVLQIKEYGGSSYFIEVEKINFENNTQIELLYKKIPGEISDTFMSSLNHDLLEQKTLLLDFSDFSANKLITHKSSILGTGKTFGMKLRFVSKGRYKIQTFGIIFKERRV